MEGKQSWVLCTGAVLQQWQKRGNEEKEKKNTLPKIILDFHRKGWETQFSYPFPSLQYPVPTIEDVVRVCACVCRLLVPPSTGDQ